MYAIAKTSKSASQELKMEGASALGQRMSGSVRLGSCTPVPQSDQSGLGASRRVQECNGERPEPVPSLLTAIFLYHLGRSAFTEVLGRNVCVKVKKAQL